MDNSIKGLVTLADIIGWKGIWRRQDSSALDNLLSIRDDIISFSKRLEASNLYKMLEEQFHIFPDLEDKMRNLNSDPVEDALKRLKSKNPEENNSLRNDLNKFLNCNKASIQIDLISDTFIICTDSLNKRIELAAHASVSKKLIELCLGRGFLIRGATSYGEYLKKESVFIGPAIDDAASWHELGQEVAIFLTPSAFLNFEDELVSAEEFIKRDDTYNLCTGGKGGSLMILEKELERRKKVSEINKKRLTGKHLSEETKRKMSRANKGKEPSNKGKSKYLVEKRTCVVCGKEFEVQIMYGRKGLCCSRACTGKYSATKKYINKDGALKRVFEEDLESWLKNGWVLGHGPV